MKHMMTICLILLLITSATFAGGTQAWTELTLHPAQSTEATQTSRLLPTAEEQTNTDAVPLYQKAIQSLPADYKSKQFSDWRSLPPDQLPVKEVESALQDLKPSLDVLTQATRCAQCNWPAATPGQVSQQAMDDLRQYRQFAFILDVQAKLQIAQGQNDRAMETIKTGLAMAKHMGDAPILVQGLVGMAIASLNLSRVEQLMQTEKAPNLYWALDTLPQPLVNMTKAIQIETDNLKNYNILLRGQFEKQLKPAHDRVRMQMGHTDRKIAALQCIEALRVYAGAHDGKFPEKLSDVTDVQIPVDPVTRNPFSYKSTGAGAVLELEATEGSEGRDAIRYELKLTQ